MKILLTNIHLAEFQGSEMCAIELAEHYTELGHKVTIYSPQIKPPLLPTIKYRDKIELTNREPDNLTEYDMVWSHQNLLLDKINRRTKKQFQIIIANHMSCWQFEERPKYVANEVDFIFANSEETINSFTADHKHKAQLMQNPVPNVTALLGPSRKKPMGISISNHRPQELTNFMVEHQDKIDFELFGEGTPNYCRVNADVLRQTNADFVICNGRSVQSALIAGLPVFIYDTFSGPGWLTQDNFHTAEYFNFSGRGFFESNLNKILDFEKYKPIELGKYEWRFRLDLWIKKMGLY